MIENNSDIKEVVKASQEIAKTTSNAIDAGRDMGEFISRFVSGSLEQGMGIVEDHLRYVRWERQHRLMKRAEEYIKQQGLTPPDKPIPLKNAVPLFFHATLEENDSLQDMWARLLINGTNESTGITIDGHLLKFLRRFHFWKSGFCRLSIIFRLKKHNMPVSLQKICQNTPPLLKKNQLPNIKSHRMI